MLSEGPIDRVLDGAQRGICAPVVSPVAAGRPFDGRTSLIGLTAEGRVAQGVSTGRVQIVQVEIAEVQHSEWYVAGSVGRGGRVTLGNFDFPAARIGAFAAVILGYYRAHPAPEEVGFVVDDVEEDVLGSVRLRKENSGRRYDSNSLYSERRPLRRRLRVPGRGPRTVPRRSSEGFLSKHPTFWRRLRRQPPRRKRCTTARCPLVGRRA